MGPWPQRVLLWLQRCPLPLEVGAAGDVALADLSEGGSCIDTSEKQVVEGEAKDACSDCGGQGPGEMCSGQRWLLVG